MTFRPPYGRSVARETKKMKLVAAHDLVIFLFLSNGFVVRHKMN
jgi:hypothetical protein